MWKARENYDPKIYGRLKAEFLKNLAQIPSKVIPEPENDQEKERLKLLKEIQEGELASTKPPK